MALSIAGGLLPDPAALAILLAALSTGRVVLGMLTVLVFSLGFASPWSRSAIVAAHIGRRVLGWLDSVWAIRLQLATTVLIISMGVGSPRRRRPVRHDGVALNRYEREQVRTRTGTNAGAEEGKMAEPTYVIPDRAGGHRHRLYRALRIARAVQRPGMGMGAGELLALPDAPRHRPARL